MRCQRLHLYESAATKHKNRKALGWVKNWDSPKPGLKRRGLEGEGWEGRLGQGVSVGEVLLLGHHRHPLQFATLHIYIYISVCFISQEMKKERSCLSSGSSGHTKDTASGNARTADS